MCLWGKEAAVVHGVSKTRSDISTTTKNVGRQCGGEMDEEARC